ncbi:tyrosine-type recombinase/integrase [Bradyrhizobium yuanmingense]|uniref:tyrosine-type recombinase/integrase n=1 Tax=Bradyrhizobium yuanmingense TaxID=108015 RepID=UPI0023B92A13|nr:tyrosine-type recombinase/integrase [Bradyrhizobium yuanmingense]MDF0583302.1 tyrosine-type recombinase/integrase [Bradyrhizobium yuanmingense]
MPVLTVPGMLKYRPAAKRREIRDSLAPGLHLVIQPKRTEDKREPARCSWAMRFRRPDGRTGKLTLGLVDFSEGENDEEPVLGAPLTLRAARQLANKVDRDRARGVDVILEYKAEKERKRAKAIDAAENTFVKLAIEFIRDHRVRRWGTWPRRWRETAALLGLRWDRSSADPTKGEPEIIPGGQADKWRDTPVSTIDEPAVHTCIDEARKKGIPGLKKRNKGKSDSRARKMYGALSAFFKWAKQQRKITANPCLDVWHPEAPPERPKRALNDAEIKVFWTATERIAEPFRSALRVLLLTGQRLKEVTGMADHELGGFLLGTPADLWTLGPDRTKNHREHHVPLSSLVREIIDAVPKVVAPPGQNFSYVFSTTGSTPISGWSKIKKNLDKAMGDVPHWTLHDLRRTTAAGMQRLGIRTEVTERALNHTSGTFGGIVGVYQIDPLAAEVKTAMERWSQHVAGLVERGDNIVLLRAEAK